MIVSLWYRMQVRRFCAVEPDVWSPRSAPRATGGPMVLAVDDLQWADEPSLRWLVYLSHRLEGLPVLVAAMTHPPHLGHSPLLAELLAVGGVRVVSPGALSEPSVAQLVSAGLGIAPDPAFVSACAKASEVILCAA